MLRRFPADESDMFAALVTAELACVPTVVDGAVSVRVRTNHEAAAAALDVLAGPVAELLADARKQAASDERARWAGEFEHLADVQAARQRAHDAARSDALWAGHRAEAFGEAARQLRRNLPTRQAGMP